MNIRDLQLAKSPPANTPCAHTPLRGAHCYACPTKAPKTSRQRVAEHRARKARQG